MSTRAWGSGVFAGLAQVLFSSRAATGLLVLAAVALVTPLSAVTALIGAMAASAFASTARWNPSLFGTGLFGVNGALLGLVWPALFDVTSIGFWLLVPAAIVTTWLQGGLLPWLSRRDLPALGVPFLVVTWTASIARALLDGRSLHPEVPPLIQGPLAGWNDPIILGTIASVTGGLLGMALVALGLALTSRRALAMAIIGAVAGLAASLALGGAEGALWIGAVAYNAAPAAVGLATLLPGARHPWALAAAGGALSVLIWALLTPVLLAAGVFPLTVPMHLVLFGALLLHRARARARSARHAAASRSSLSAAPDAAALSGLLRRASRVVVLSGAGMSTESGIPDYRSQVGFWYDANPDDLVYQRLLASEQSRHLYWRLQRRFISVVEEAQPNAGHQALARLDATGRLLGVVTQNVDGLHQAAGCQPGRVVELHGSARWIVCVNCRRRVPYRDLSSRINGHAPLCDACGGLLKTETVSFGEGIPSGRLGQAIAWCREADLLLILGTSLQVEPACSLPKLARTMGTPIVVVNRTPTAWDVQATLAIHDEVGAVLADAVGQLRGRRIRPMTRADFHYLCRVVDAWWGDAVRYLLHPLYVDHFADTCFVLDDEHGLAGFVIGFVSQSRPEEAYVHMIGTAPEQRGQGVGLALYEHFFAAARARGCRRVAAVTVPGNAGSLAFHRRLGFEFRSAGAVWEADVPILPDHAGPGVPCVVMERAL